jgi:cytochrome c-type biogenesis protein CcmH
MTGFIIGAAALALLAVLFVVLPLLRSRGAAAAAPPAAIAAMVAALGLIAVSAVIYSLLGSPAGVRAAANAASGPHGPSEALAALARHVEQDPGDTLSWVQLGAAYANAGQYGLALHAYQQANGLTHGDDANVLADIGETLLLQNNGAPSEQAGEFLNRALSIDAHQPKALFYGALIAYRTGQLQLARDRFEALLNLTPPPPQNLRVALQQQIEQIDAQLHPQVDAATAIHLRVQLASALASKAPPNASLFVFVQADDGGPPLAVKRAEMKLPQDIDLSSSDSMVATRSVKPGQKVTVVARISASGNPLPQSGDPYGQIDDYIAGKTGPRSLEINKLTP